MEGNQDPFDIENQHIPLATCMRDELNKLSPQPPMVCCIYRVPDRLRRVNEKVYTPQVVSIGPFHHGKESLKAMEEHKKRYLQGFLTRTRVSLEEYVKKIKYHEAKLRSCYEESTKFNSDEFVRIILVDAAFIIELLLRCCRQHFNIIGLENDENDRILNKPWLIHYIAPDMQLLENQLPFFILEDLFDPDIITVSSNSKKLSMINLSYEFLTMTLELEGAEDSLQRISSSSSNPKVEHFLDFIRTLHLTKLEETDQSNEGRSKNFMTTHCITKLHQAGVKFKLASSRNLFDIKFDDGILVIPKLKISDHTELTLRNLIAFEQCHCQNNYISDYVSLMDNFVNTEKDVEYLLKDGIVEHMLGDDNKVCTLINNLGRGVVLHREGYHFATLSESLNSYCREPWHKWKANLRQNYFNTPWATISVIAAVFLLILTCVQAVCSIISVMPSKNQK
ncbi:UPF0481 protein At3g47200-like [Prunus avium]|uniref:UPF0481 protein At3g47200-like n=1 Tax=Prunus avium TaxID=42229 RepID=A0A6P5RJI9_PRUAV|nr:UPF0481 protein At3g47200-like [Prunus avium]XP_021802036.1 UPF0481 protein At3g47200-like [Prunus avium]XP_021802038.1 UPF0481 protein At3g47200-like [Prunus avium]